MLKQILKVGYVDQELLEVLTEEQKDVRIHFVFAMQLHIIIMFVCRSFLEK